jgi:hypothetical protein
MIITTLLLPLGHIPFKPEPDDEDKIPPTAVSPKQPGPDKIDRGIGRE